MSSAFLPVGRLSYRTSVIRVASIAVCVYVMSHSIFSIDSSILKLTTTSHTVSFNKYSVYLREARISKPHGARSIVNFTFALTSLTRPLFMPIVSNYNHKSISRSAFESELIILITNLCILILCDSATFFSPSPRRQFNA